MDAGTQMGRTCDEVALINVVGTDAADEKFLDESFHHHGVVIHVAEEDGLVAEGDAGIGEATECSADFSCEFARVIGMNTDEERMVLLQHGAEFRSDALREKDGNAGADSQKFDVGNGAELPKQEIEFVIAQEERVTAAEENIADRWGAANVIDLFFEFGMEIISAGITDEPGAGAIAAVRGASVGDEEEDAVGVAMNQARNR
jgi:hypothetical protein